MTTADRAERLASWREFCKCTDDHQHDPRCDGSRCVEQEKAIATALAADADAPASPTQAKLLKAMAERCNRLVLDLRKAQVALCPRFVECGDKEGDGCVCFPPDGPYANAIPPNRAASPASGGGAGEDGYTDEDMAVVGRSLMETLRVNYPKWAPLQDPAEVVVDLLNEIHDLKAASPAPAVTEENFAEKVQRLQREIGERQAELHHLVCGDPSKSVSETMIRGDRG